MNEDTYSTLVSGFDVEMQFDDSVSTADVQLFEGGAQVWTTTIDITPFTYSTEGEVYTEDVINDTAQAAVDLFEAERDTLGQGAETLTVEGTVMKKHSYFESLYWEDWYMDFKGTAFCDQATQLLEQYLATYAPTEGAQDVELAKTQAKLDELRYAMDMLYFEKLKGDPGGQKVIIINALNKKSYVDIDDMRTWLDAFKGHKLEPQAVALAKESLDTQAKLDNLNDAQDGGWETREELRYAMEELKIQLIQMGLDQQANETLSDVAPKMMNDMFELADGVDFDEPMEPMSELPPTLYEDPNTENMFANTAANHTVANTADSSMFANKFVASSEDDDEDVELEVEEQGQLADGVQIAEIPVDRRPFNVSERIETTKDFKQVLWGGITKLIPKGTKGRVDDLFDRAGDYYYILFDDGRLVKLPFDHLKRMKKGQ